jgi:hypothetical protein
MDERDSGRIQSLIESTFEPLLTDEEVNRPKSFCPEKPQFQDPFVSLY